MFTSKTIKFGSCLIVYLLILKMSEEFIKPEKD